MTNRWDLYGQFYPIWMKFPSGSTVSQSKALEMLPGSAHAVEQGVWALATLGKAESHKEWVHFYLSWPPILSTGKLKWLHILYLTLRREADDRKEPLKHFLWAETASSPLLPRLLSFHSNGLFSWAYRRPKLRLLSQCPLQPGAVMRLNSGNGLKQCMQFLGLALKGKGHIFPSLLSFPSH